MSIDLKIFGVCRFQVLEKSCHKTYLGCDLHVVHASSFILG